MTAESSAVTVPTYRPEHRSVEQYTGRIAALECRCDSLREQLDGMTASRDHARWECRAHVESLSLSHEVREELSDECDRLTAELDAVRDERDEARALVEELTLQRDDARDDLTDLDAALAALQRKTQEAP